MSSQEANDARLARLAQEEADAQFAQQLAAQQGSAVSYPGSSGRRRRSANTTTTATAASNNNNYTNEPSHGKNKSMMARMLDSVAKTAALGNNHDDGSSAMFNNSNSLLYVPCIINSRMVEMMVDSGSQTSVMSSSMMRQLNLQHRLDKRYQGVAAGVGSASILGRIDNCPVLIGDGVEFKLYFLVIDVPHDMMILGIDQLRRFKCLISLEKNVLIFGGHGGLEVPFLPPDPNHVDAREQCTIS